jgi:Holliday junction resolvasome RuvABC DNA-binding subunit
MSMSSEEEDKSSDDNSLEHLEFENPTPLEQDAAQMHEMFEALMKVGFTERQALQLVAFLMTEASEDGAVNLFFDETFLKRMHEGFDEEEEDDGQNS